MLKYVTVNNKKNSILLLFIICLPSLVVAGQTNTMIIENTNLAFEQCMRDVPVIETITHCDDANACWARWLAQYKSASYHKFSCLRAYGGIDYSYHYPVATRPKQLVQQLAN